MLLRIKYIFIILIIAASQSISQTIQSINVEGNKVFSSSEISGWSGINTGSKVVHGIIDSVKSRLAFQLAQRGYLHSTFNDTKLVYGADSQKVELKISIN